MLSIAFSSYAVAYVVYYSMGMAYLKIDFYKPEIFTNVNRDDGGLKTALAVVWRFLNSLWQKLVTIITVLWSKTPLITSSVGRTWVDPPPRKMDTFFLRSLAQFDSKFL